MATGWKVVWAIGPERIVKLGGIINAATSYIANHPAQIAMAKALDYIHEPNNTFLEDTRKKFEEVRNFLFKEIKEMALLWEPLPCQSGYFLMADVNKCRDLIPEIYFETHEYEPEFNPESVDDSGHIVKNVLYMTQKEGDKEEENKEPKLPLARLTSEVKRILKTGNG